MQRTTLTSMGKSLPSITRFWSLLERSAVRSIGGEFKREACLDLIIGDMPDGLPILGVSNPTNDVPAWNMVDSEYAERIFEFANVSLQDNGAILVFLPNNPSTLEEVNADARTYGYRTLHQWWGVNDLYLTSHEELNGTTKCLHVRLYVRFSLNDRRVDSQFCVETNKNLPNRSKKITGEGVLNNFTTEASQLMNKHIPWRGAREKDTLLLQLLIESITRPDNVVLDCSASTGASVHACKRTGRHIIALESDAHIFNNVLSLLNAPDSKGPPWQVSKNSLRL